MQRHWKFDNEVDSVSTSVWNANFSVTCKFKFQYPLSFTSQHLGRELDYCYDTVDQQASSSMSSTEKEEKNSIVIACIGHYAI